MTEENRDGWHQPLRHIRAGELTGDTGQTNGMTRLGAVSAKKVGSQRVWMGQTHVAPQTSSGDHHHGDSETAIYVVRGNPVFVFAEDGEEVRLQTGPGDYVFVPPHTPHPAPRTGRRTRPTRRSSSSSHAAARRRSW